MAAAFARQPTITQSFCLGNHELKVTAQYLHGYYQVQLHIQPCVLECDGHSLHLTSRVDIAINKKVQFEFTQLPILTSVLIFIQGEVLPIWGIFKGFTTSEYLMEPSQTHVPIFG